MSGRYRKTSHVIYEGKYHLCGLPKYRYPILTGLVALRVRERIRPIAAANEGESISGAVSSDHVHIYVSMPPSLSVSKFVQCVKGASSRKISLEFEDIRKRYWGQPIWARGYFVATAGNVTDDMIRDYIRRQGKEDDKADEFRSVNH